MKNIRYNNSMGMTVEEIAEAMDMTVQEVQDTLDSAMIKLLQALHGVKLTEKEKLQLLLEVLTEEDYGNTTRKRKV
jgi:predicted DNA-binding protein (UPF0251 family)